MDNSKPTVFVVDDDKEVRESLQMLIESIDLQVKTYDSAKRFLDDYDLSWPGCLVLDVRMPKMNGLELQATLLARKMDIPIIFLSGYADIPMAVEAVKMGAVDFMEKPFREQVFLDNIQKAIKMDTQKRRRAAQRKKVEERMLTLSPREREVMELLMTGETNKKVGYQLGISPKTVDFHRTNILEKMGAGSVIELVLMMGTVRSGVKAGTPAASSMPLMMIAR